MYKNTTKYTIELMRKTTMFAASNAAVIFSAMFVIVGGLIGLLNYLDGYIAYAVAVWVVCGLLAAVFPAMLINGGKKGIEKRYYGPGINDMYCTNNFVFDEQFMYARTVRNDLELSRDTLPYEFMLKVVAHNDYLQIFVTAVTLHVVTREGMTEGSYEDLVALIAGKIPGKFTNKIKHK